jgi:hypoxanthine phosphoribosyltransferase
MDKKYFSWEDINKLSDNLVQKIEESGFVPDCLVGITVGGLVPLALVAKKMNITDVTTISATSYDGDEQGDIVVRNVPSVDLRGKKVLLIDEMADTGKTLKRISVIIADQLNCSEMRTGVLIVKPKKCTHMPDFHVVEDDRWIIFPWEELGKGTP